MVAEPHKGGSSPLRLSNHEKKNDCDNGKNCSSAAYVHHKTHMDYAKNKDVFLCQYYATKGLNNGAATRRELQCWKERNLLL